MTKKEIIRKTAEFTRKTLEGETTGHDFLHVQRVWKNAIKIAKKENVDLFVVELAALLHDIADWKFNKGNEKVGSKVARDWLKKLKVDEKVIEEVSNIVERISFKGAGVKNQITTKEGLVVQDADRLDALGAIGIARCFATGAQMGREIYNPKIKPLLHKTFAQYKNSKSTSINHFCEKLLLVKNRMNTKTGKQIAKTRHEFLEEFLERFNKEVNP